ncbi:MAG: B12-binding domain-containing radical SAM protein, partial [Eggerthellaceae bacterium]|nr:B12-binding domain-containing radical SAM protein [Eggerthellaceae bacterium]
RECGLWVEAAWKRGARFDAWTELFNKNAWDEAAMQVGIDPIRIARATYSSDTVMPWSHISTGVSTDFLKKERERAYAEITTPDCTFDACSACGACASLRASNMLAGERNG